MLELLRKKKSLRILIVAGAAIAALAGAFCYNPVMTVLLPLLALYVAARAIDWAITGGDHIDQKISVKFVAGILIFVLLFGIVRNIPVYPFNLLVPGGLFELF